jgi:hypothetical protein
VLAASITIIIIIIIIALMMEAASTSETSVNYQVTQRKNTEGNHLQTCCHENFKCHVTMLELSK